MRSQSSTIREALEVNPDTARFRHAGGYDPLFGAPSVIPAGGVFLGDFKFDERESRDKTLSPHCSLAGHEYPREWIKRPVFVKWRALRAIQVIWSIGPLLILNLENDES